MSDCLVAPSVSSPDPQVVVGGIISQSRADKDADVARLSSWEHLLFDGDDQVRTNTSAEQANTLLGSINGLRRQLGWLCLDLAHHHCWPEDGGGVSWPLGHTG